MTGLRPLNSAGEDLSICTVSFHHGAFVRRNIDLAAGLNPDSTSRFRWIVVENTPGSSALPQDSDAPFPVQWIEGARSGAFSGPSAHHAAAIDKALGLVKTPYLLVVDPDFFILRKHWVADALRHMEERGLAALGAPWNPIWYGKPRYAPACAHCLFLDMRRLDAKMLDFQPVPSAAATPRRRVPGSFARLLEAALHSYRLCWQNRKLVGRDKDTGYRIAEALENARLSFECFVPVFDPVRDFQGSAIFRYLDRFFEDGRRYVPGNDRYFSRSGFDRFGLESARAFGCEEFLWKDAPFGVHFRGQPKRMTGEYDAASRRFFAYLDRTASGV
jgi:hypothetical protein